MGICVGGDVPGLRCAPAQSVLVVHDTDATPRWSLQLKPLFRIHVKAQAAARRQFPCTLTCQGRRAKAESPCEGTRLVR